MANLIDGALVAPLLAGAIPVVFLLGGALSPRRAGVASALGLGLAGLFTAGVALGLGAGASGDVRGVRVDAVTCLMLLLVTGLGALVIRYSKTYLEGEPALPRYFRWLLVTLAAVTTLVSSDDLAVIAAAWTATSLSLHQLLTFYADRTAARVAAHKKFLVSRLADVSLLGALALVHHGVGSFRLADIAAWVTAHPGLSPGMQLGAVLLVVAVALRSAQLPFHGWLIQVMEAPTPVSALLHAGVVNIGGFVLIRLAPWMSEARAAQVLLVGVGLVSAVAAALVMTTRVSIKVALAWSTCAQMGFMLVQCGLGLWPLALLHLVAHSLYKAHAFLGAGSVVEGWKRQALRGARPPAGPRAVVLAALTAAVGMVMVAVIGRAAGGFAPGEELPALVLAGLVALSLTPLWARGASSLRAKAALVGRAAAVVAFYVFWHLAASSFGLSARSTVHVVDWLAVGLGLLALFSVKTALQRQGAFARALHPWLFAGFYLDEHFTRLAFRVWPPRLRASGHPPREVHVPQPMEARA